MFAHHEQTLSAWSALVMLGSYVTVVVTAVIRKRIKRKGK